MIYETVISVSNIRKAYRLWNEPSARLKAPALDSLAKLFPERAAPREKLRIASTRLYSDFIALDNINFTIKHGESVGIIGINGSGKSTLLQIIAGTLQPTSGNVTTRGRIAALLELGSGFNLEFSGRENVYIYGTILGLGKKEVDQKFEEIEDFADIGEFINQPVKTYSSGMVVRLAFAVQSVINPDILIVDEALSVGDVFFQAKCMKRIRELQESGTTILFVSHSMNAVREMCTRAILLDRGKQIVDTSAVDATQLYLKVITDKDAENAIGSNTSNNEIHLRKRDSASGQIKIVSEFGNREIVSHVKTGVDILYGQETFEKLANIGRVSNKKATILNVQLLNADGNLSATFDYGEPATYRLVIKVNTKVPHLWVGYHVRTKTGVDIIHGDSSLMSALDFKFEQGKTYLVDWGFRINLMHGDYYMTASLGILDPPGVTAPEWEYVDITNNSYAFSVVPRKQGMIGGTATWDNVLRIGEVV